MCVFPDLSGRLTPDFLFFFSPLPNFVVSIAATPVRTLGEAKVESHASSETQPNQAALLLDTTHIQPGSQPHQCVGGNTVHLETWSACNVPGPPQASLVRDIPASQTLPNPDNARPIVRRPMDLPVVAGCNRTWAQTQSL